MQKFLLLALIFSCFWGFQCNGEVFPYSLVKNEKYDIQSSKSHFPTTYRPLSPVLKGSYGVIRSETCLRARILATWLSFKSTLLCRSKPDALSVITLKCQGQQYFAAAVSLPARSDPGFAPLCPRAPPVMA